MMGMARYERPKEPAEKGAHGRRGMFFFSSRRRHTRFDCDWSSDVCSSDLPCPGSGRVLAYVAVDAGGDAVCPNVVGPHFVDISWEFDHLAERPGSWKYG